MNPRKMALLFHPIVGMLSFDDPDLCSDTAEDIGEMFDLNDIGTLKSRVYVVWS